MLKRKALKKILVTSLSLIIVLALYLIPNVDEKIVDNNFIPITYEIDKQYIYLLNKDDLLVRTSMVVEQNTELEQLKDILSNLIIFNNSLIPYGLSGLIPKNTEILSLKVIDNIVEINFSSEFLKIKTENIIQVIEAVIFTIFDNTSYEKVKILVNNEVLMNKVSIKLPAVFTKDFGINKRYDIRNRENINKYVVYYIDKTGDDFYYVPITKYVNSTDDKIKIIIEDLSSSYIYEPNLVSYLNQKTELINYEINEDTMILNFNNSIFMYDDIILEEVIYTISYSVFDNYDVDAIVFRVEDEDFSKKVLKYIE